LKYSSINYSELTRQHRIRDASLVTAVDNAIRGLIDADLGGHVIKQRVARAGQGKRGGFRMLIGFRSDRAIFLYGFAKNERENIDSHLLKTLREIVVIWFAADEKRIAQALADGILIEIHHGTEDKSKPTAH
jgi:hypothetical protein